METTQSQDGTTIAFDRTGTGSPVILVAGALGARMGNIRLAELLEERFSVLNYDRRGRGDSGDSTTYHAEREIEDLAAMVEEAGGSASVLGRSSGANLVLKAAAGGLGVTGLALWEPNFLVDDSRPPLPDDYPQRIRELVGADRRGDAVELFMTEAVGLPDEFVTPMRGAPHWAHMEASAHTLAYDGEIVEGFAVPDVASVDIPVLVIDGDTTPWLSAGAEAIANALPNARRRTLDGQTHDVAPEALAPALVEFFS